MAKKQQRPRRRVPQRTCVACRGKFGKRDITRVVRTPDQGVVVDPTGKLNGRGAYLCADPACWDKALATGVLNRALKTTLTEAEKEAVRLHRPKTAAT